MVAWRDENWSPKLKYASGSQTVSGRPPFRSRKFKTINSVVLYNSPLVIHAFFLSYSSKKAEKHKIHSANFTSQVLLLHSIRHEPSAVSIHYIREKAHITAANISITWQLTPAQKWNIMHSEPVR